MIGNETTMSPKEAFALALECLTGLNRVDRDSPDRFQEAMATATKALEVAAKTGRRGGATANQLQELRGCAARIRGMAP